MSKRSANLIAGLDVGSSAVRIVVGQATWREGRVGDAPELQILGAAETVSEGIHKGAIKSIEDTVSSISACLERAERMVGLPIDRVYLGVSGVHIVSKNSKGFVAVSKADSEITAEDVARAIEASRSIATPLNYEVLHIFPRGYTVDDQPGIKDPVGMTGIRLEVETQIILGSSSQLKNLTTSVYRTGLEIDEMVLSVIAASEAALTSRQKDLGVVLVNLGAATTTLSVFEEGNVLHTATIPLGAEHITNDVAIGLRTSIDLAEKAKVDFGNCFSEAVSKKDEFDLYEFGSSEHELVKKRYLSEVIEARMEEILYKVDQELKSVARSGLLPAGVVFIGGGAKLPGLVDLAKKVLRLPASLGYPLNILSITEKINDLSFTAAVGLVKWGSGSLYGGHGSSSYAPALGGGLGKTAGRAAIWFKRMVKDLIP